MIAQPKYDGLRKYRFIECDMADLEGRVLAHMMGQSTPKSKHELYALLYGATLPMKKTYHSQAVKQHVGIDLTKCPHEIRDALALNKGFRCEGRDDTGDAWRPFVVTGFTPEGSYSFVGFEPLDNEDDIDNEFKHVRWIIEEPRVIVKSKEEILENLLERGYTLSVDKTFYKATCCYNFRMMMFDSCGKEPSGNFTWSEHWLKSVGSSQEVFNTMND